MTLRCVVSTELNIAAVTTENLAEEVSQARLKADLVILSRSSNLRVCPSQQERWHLQKKPAGRLSEGKRGHPVASCASPKHELLLWDAMKVTDGPQLVTQLSALRL